MTRQEHMQWCKARALEYLSHGPHYSINGAAASMLSDLGKHVETAGLQPMARMLFLTVGSSEDAARKFITGFN